MLGRPRLRHERRAARPLAAHAEAEADAEDDELRERRREPARRGEDRIEHDAQHQRARAPESIGDPAEADAAGGGGEQRRPTERAAGARSRVQGPARTAGSTSANSMTSNASSIHPSPAAMTARRPSGVAFAPPGHQRVTRSATPRPTRSLTPARSSPREARASAPARPACRRACRSCRPARSASSPSVVMTIAVDRHPHRALRRRRPRRG